MELDLQSKARLFKRKFDNYYIENDLAGSLNIDIFSETYDEQLKAFYKEQKLDNYDPLALNSSFFNTTSNFRNERYQQHSASVMAKIKGQTEKSFTHNVSGTIIDGQDDAKTANEVLTDLKGLTDGFISVSGGGRISKMKANELFILGFNKYVSTVKDEEGFAFAQELLIELKDFKLGTGAFGGSPEGSGIIQDLEMELSTKELSFYDSKKKRETVTDDINKQELENTYWEASQKEGIAFNVLNLVNERIQATDFTNGDYTFSPEDKNYLLTLHTALEKAQEVTHNDQNALMTLMRLQDDDIYAVKDTAFALLQDLKITPQTFREFYKSANTHEFFKNNIHFVRSTVYQNYMAMFKDKNLAQIPLFSAEAPAMRNLLQENLYQWYQDNKSKYSGSELTKQLDFQVKAELGDIISNSMVIQSDYERFAKLFATYGIVIQAKVID